MGSQESAWQAELKDELNEIETGLKNFEKDKPNKKAGLRPTVAALKSWRLKGPVSRYMCKGTSFSVASRDGDLYVSAPAAADVTAISFAPFDLNHNTTRPVSKGDIIEFVESKNLRNAGEVSRYQSAGMTTRSDSCLSKRQQRI